MRKKIDIFKYITKSKFIRSIFIWEISIFSIVIIAVVLMVSFMFSSKINKNTIKDRQKQLEVVEDTISKRMEEILSISYNISQDKNIYITPVEEDKYSEYEMTETLNRYLVGNDFIDYLAYYRLSEPDKIYTSSGKLKFSNFWSTYLEFDNYTQEEYIEKIKSSTNSQIDFFSSEKHNKSYFTYVTQLPQFSINPQAFIIIYIPLSTVKPVLESQLTNFYGKVSVFDSNGDEIYQLNNLNEEISINLKDYEDNNYNGNESKNISINGKRYILQGKKSDVNDWTYVSVIQLNVIISEIIKNLIIFIAFLLLIMVMAVVVLLCAIVKKYKPINNLALSFADITKENDDTGVIDEKNLLSNIFAILKGDSEQKQKFETAYYEANAANKAKSEFLSNMSHDIRTPMNAIVGMTEIALKNTKDPNHVKECLQKVQVASQYLMDIINNVLDMSRIESGKITLSKEVIELPKLIYAIVAIINQSIESNGQYLIVEAENVKNEKIIGDSVRLTQVFMNILSNAVKFTPSGGTIKLHISQTESTEEGYGNYKFIFSDTGIGIPSEFIDQVFDTFTRAKKADMSKIQGTGLGMAIAKNLVELMGGTIKCESKVDNGTTFTVIVHMELANDKFEGLEEKLEKYAKKYKNNKVLILGKDENTCIVQSDLFNNVNIKAEYALTLSEALKMIEKACLDKKAYKFVIINQSDDDKNGISAVTSISKAAKSKETTYILAAKDFIGIDQVKSTKAGIDAFIHIPLFKSSIYDILENKFEFASKMNSLKTDIINLKGKNILMVEDNLINKEIAKIIISETKANIIEASNGKEAVEAFENSKEGYFDVILMDVQMPVMDGYEATNIIRSMKRKDAHTVPIYALTANTFAEDISKVKKAGMNGHIGKPYKPDTIYKVLEKLINSKEDM